MMNSKQYIINGKTYIQRPLVLGQFRQLIGVVKDIQIPPTLNAMLIASSLGDSLPRAIAVVITESGVKLREKEKNIDKAAAEIEFDLSLELAVEIIEDFFDLTLTPALINRIRGMMKKAGMGITLSGASKKSASSSPEGTSQNATTSSGDTPSENASPT